MSVLRILATGIALAAAPLSALACTCVFDDSPLAEKIETAVRDSAVVAEVEILSTSVAMESRNVSGRKWSWTDRKYHDYSEVVDEPKLVAQLKVLRYWKGEQHALVSIRTATTWQACGLAFKPGQHLLLYAWSREGDNRLDTHSCTRTKAAAEAGEEMRMLNRMRGDAPSNNALKGRRAKRARP